MERLRQEVEAIVGRAGVSRRPVHDLWPVRLMRERSGDHAPDVLVARPATKEQAARLLAVASRRRVRVVPFGAGKGVCGAAEAGAGELGVDMGALAEVVEINERDLTCTVGAGATAGRLEEALNERGLTLGHIPASLPFSTIGGLISTLSSGQQSSLYGNIEDHLLALAVAFPDGTVAGLRPGPRSAVGPALHQLFCGAGGPSAWCSRQGCGSTACPRRWSGGGPGSMPWTPAWKPCARSPRETSGPS